MNYKYDGNSKKEIIEEITNEISGITNLIITEPTEENFNYLKGLVLDLEEISNKKENVRTKNLQHARFQKELEKQGINSERFDVTYTNKEDGYYCMMCHDRTSIDETSFAVWINYQSRSIIVWNNNNNETIKELTNKYYNNKGYSFTFTNNDKWCQ